MSAMPTPGVEALARAITSLAHGKCCWEPAIDAGDILAALSAADRLAIAGITEERLEAALHIAEIDCNPLMPVGGFYETPLAKHVAASNHDGSAERLLAALATPVTPEGGEPE